MYRFIVPIVILLLILGIGFASIASNFIVDFSDEQKSDVPWNTDLTEDWNINLKDPIVSTPIVDQNIVFIQTHYEIIALDLSSKSIKWKLRLDGDSENCSMYFIDNLLLIPSVKGEVIALNSKNGKLIWRAKLTVGNDREFIEDIKADNEYAYIAVFSGKLSVLSLSDGKILWEKNVPNRSRLFIFLQENQIILMGWSTVTAFNKKDGAQNWNTEISGGILAFSFSEKTLYLSVLDETQQLYAIDFNSGTILWKFASPIARLECVTPYDEKLILSGDGLSLFDLEQQKVLWSNTKITNLTCPIVVDDKIFVRKRIRNLYEFDYLTGKLDSRYKISWFTPYSIQRSVDPILVGDLILLPKTKSSLSVVEKQ